MWFVVAVNPVYIEWKILNHDLWVVNIKELEEIPCINESLYNFSWNDQTEKFLKENSYIDYINNIVPTYESFYYKFSKEAMSKNESDIIDWEKSQKSDRSELIKNPFFEKELIEEAKDILFKCVYKGVVLAMPGRSLYKVVSFQKEVFLIQNYNKTWSAYVEYDYERLSVQANDGLYRYILNEKRRLYLIENNKRIYNNLRFLNKVPEYKFNRACVKRLPGGKKIMIGAIVNGINGGVVGCFKHSVFYDQNTFYPEVGGVNDKIKIINRSNMSIGYYDCFFVEKYYPFR